MMSVRSRFLSIIIAGCLVCHQPTGCQELHGSLNFNGLCDDLLRYEKSEGVHHAGHLYEHSVWVTKAIEKMFDEKSKWKFHLSDSDRKLMTLAGFLHDIGKAGDLDFLYSVKPTHPQVGFEYLLGKSPYKLNEKETFDFEPWFEQLGVSKKDKKRLAILVGMHQRFALSVLKPIRDGAEPHKAYRNFLRELAKYCAKAGYITGPDLDLVAMCIMLCRADMQGMLRVDHPCSCATELFDMPESLPATPIMDPKLVDTVGYLIATQLMHYAKNNSNLLVSRILHFCVNAFGKKK